nr:hypothetical protein [bacterium]
IPNRSLRVPSRATFTEWVVNMKPVLEEHSGKIFIITQGQENQGEPVHNTLIYPTETVTDITESFIIGVPSYTSLPDPTIKPDQPSQLAYYSSYPDPDIPADSEFKNLFFAAYGIFDNAEGSDGENVFITGTSMSGPNLHIMIMNYLRTRTPEQRVELAKLKPYQQVQAAYLKIFGFPPKVVGYRVLDGNIHAEFTVPSVEIFNSINPVFKDPAITYAPTATLVISESLAGSYASRLLGIDPFSTELTEVRPTYMQPLEMRNIIDLAALPKRARITGTNKNGISEVFTYTFGSEIYPVDPNLLNHMFQLLVSDVQITTTSIQTLPHYPGKRLVPPQFAQEVLYLPVVAN